ncbi:MAG TPA: P1 family peptidase, partial [Dehalococcoidia bacterium]|nr:P1 family peptidase [Dehalococcoidia bacterium]
AQDDRALTGCTVVLAEAGAVGGVDVRGSAPGTRETDLLRPGTLVDRVHAVLLSGGSAYGLDAAAGVVRYLAERSIGFPVAAGVVPIVPAAVLFDLSLGDGSIRPDPDMAYCACLAARSDGVDQGNVGAGTGASVGKALGIERAMKGGIGSASERLAGGVVVGAIVAMNCWGHVIDPESGRILAGPRDPATNLPVDTLTLLRRGLPHRPFQAPEPPGNTIIGLVATNARLTKDQAGKVAQMAQTGLARVVVPCHTMFDGDALFALSTGTKRAEVTAIGTFAAEAIRRAALRAILHAQPAGGLPAAEVDIVARTQRPLR